MQNFAITIRKHGCFLGKIRESDYDIVIDHLGGFLVQHVFERDKTKDHCHMHGVLALPSGYLRKKLTLRGFNMKFVPIFNMAGWLAYMAKDPELRDTVRLELFIQDYPYPDK